MCVVILLLVLLALIFSIYLTVSFIGLLVTLVMAAIIGWLAWKVVPIKLPYGFLGAVVAGLLGSWLGGWLLGDVGPEIGGIAVFPALVGSMILAVISTVVTRGNR